MRSQYKTPCIYTGGRGRGRHPVSFRRVSTLYDGYGIGPRSPSLLWFCAAQLVSPGFVSSSDVIAARKRDPHDAMRWARANQDGISPSRILFQVLSCHIILFPQHLIKSDAIVVLLITRQTKMYLTRVGFGFIRIGTVIVDFFSSQNCDDEASRLQSVSLVTERTRMS